MKHLSRSILLLIFLLGSSMPTFACWCSQISFEEEVEKTDFIFVGKVVEITEDEEYVPPKIKIESEVLKKLVSSTKRFLIKLEIIRKFKGIETDEITLVKYKIEGNTCPGVPFDKDETYLIYASKNKKTKEVHDKGVCSWTELFNKKSKSYKDLKKLLKIGKRNHKYVEEII